MLTDGMRDYKIVKESLKKKLEDLDSKYDPQIDAKQDEIAGLEDAVYYFEQQLEDLKDAEQAIEEQKDYYYQTIDPSTEQKSSAKLENLKKEYMFKIEASEKINKMCEETINEYDGLKVSHEKTKKDLETAINKQAQIIKINQENLRVVDIQLRNITEPKTRKLYLDQRNTFELSIKKAEQATEHLKVLLI